MQCTVSCAHSTALIVALVDMLVDMGWSVERVVDLGEAIQLIVGGVSSEGKEETKLPLHKRGHGWDGTTLIRVRAARSESCRISTY